MLITSDLHLTDQVGDEYRWDLFPFLIHKANKYKQKRLYILGDVTDYKNNHSARLVNRVVESLLNVLSDSCIEEIHILKGNHDYIDSDLPFFYFLNCIPNIKFHVQPVILEDDVVGKLLLLPHSRDPEHEWPEVLGTDMGKVFSKCDLVMMHQTINGSLASNGMKMAGLSRAFFKRAKKVYSGDIHVPQVMGNIEYVGAPYTIRFNDVYRPRVLMVDENGKQTNLRLLTASKVTVTVKSITDVKDAEIREGDQVKLKVHLSKEQTSYWKDYREELISAAKSKGASTVKIFVIIRETSRKRLNKSAVPLVLNQVEDTDILKAYASSESIDNDLVQYGEELLGRQNTHERIDTAGD